MILVYSGTCRLGTEKGVLISEVSSFQSVLIKEVTLHTPDLHDILFPSPSLKNLMIVTESLTKGTKFVFNTSQVSKRTM